MAKNGVLERVERVETDLLAYVRVEEEGGAIEYVVRVADAGSAVTNRERIGEAVRRLRNPGRRPVVSLTGSVSVE